MKRLVATGPVWIAASALVGLAGCSGTQTASLAPAGTSVSASRMSPPAVSPTPSSESAPTPAAACYPPPEGQAFEPCYDTGPAQEKVPYDASNAPRFFTQRAVLPSCGTYDLGNRLTPSVASDCFAAALGGPDGAEYAVSRSTTEGDPIIAYYRTLPGQSAVTVIYDGTRDNFGTRGWSQWVCRDYDPAIGSDPTVANLAGCETGSPVAPALAPTSGVAGVDIRAAVQGQAQQALTVGVSEVRQDPETKAIYATVQARGTTADPVGLWDLVSLTEVRASPAKDGQAPLLVRGQCAPYALPTGETYEPCAAVRLVSVVSQSEPPLSARLVMQGTGGEAPRGTYRLRFEVTSLKAPPSSLTVTVQLA